MSGDPRKPADVVREEIVFPLIRRMESLGVIELKPVEPKPLTARYVGDGRVEFSDGRLPVKFRGPNQDAALEAFAKNDVVTHDELKGLGVTNPTSTVLSLQKRLVGFIDKIPNRGGWSSTIVDARNIR